MNSAYFSDPSSYCFVALFISLGISMALIALDAALKLYMHQLYLRTVKKLIINEDFRAAMKDSAVAAETIANMVIAEHERTAKSHIEQLMKGIGKSRLKKVVEQERQRALLDNLSSLASNVIEAKAKVA